MKFQVTQYDDKKEPRISEPLEAADMPEAVEFFVLSGDIRPGVRKIIIEELPE